MDPDVVPQHKLPPHLYSIRKDQWPERSEGHDVRRFLQGQTEAIKGVCDHAISCDEFSNDPRCFFPWSRGALKNHIKYTVYLSTRADNVYSVQ